MKKYIIEQTKATQAVITPVGVIMFKGGVAKEFNDEQAEFFEGQEGYELSDSLEAENEPVTTSEAEAPVASENEPEVTDTKPALPVLQDSLKEILAFADTHKVNLVDVRKSAKKPVLEAIYAHFGE